MTEQTQPTDALAKLRHLYANMLNGGVRDTASAKRIAEGLLSPAIAELEKWGTPAGAGEVVAVKAMGYGGSTGINDYLMSDGTVKAMRPAEVRWATKATPQPTQAQAGAVPLKYARLHAISLDYSNSEDECTGFRDGWRAAEKHHGIKGADHA